MNKFKINFSHNYPKLHNQKTARLLAVEFRDRKELDEKMVIEDTLYIVEEGARKGCRAFYPLKTSKYMVLVFLGDKLIPFTTIRSCWPPDKVEHYQSAIGQVFDLIVEVKEDK